MNPREERETEHFWYRLAPADPYVDSQRQNMAFGFRDGTVLLSEDNGKTWPHSAEFPDANNITFSCIQKNGNVVFATRAKLYLSTDMIIEDGVILSAHYAPASPYHTGLIISPDMGKTWAQYDLKQFGKRSPVRFQKKNRDGWFRADLRKGWIERGEVLFIKPK